MQNLYYLILRVHLNKEEQENTDPYGGVAQLGEHLPCKQGVRSSILLISTKGSKRDSGKRH